jgi:hypothetical protein
VTREERGEIAAENQYFSCQQEEGEEEEEKFFGARREN